MKKSTKAEYHDNTDKIEISRFSSLKNVTWGGLRMTKLEEIILSPISKKILITNLFAVDRSSIFALFLGQHIK